MATLNITEYDEFETIGGQLTAPKVPPLVEQTQLTYTTSAASAAMNKGTRLIEVTTGATVAHLAWGSAPTATVNFARMAANQTKFFIIKEGWATKGTLKLAAYDGSS